MIHIPSQGIRATLFTVIVIVTLFVGLNPKDFRFRNPVKWTSDGPGIELGQYGSAHTEPFLTADLSHRIQRDGWTLEVALHDPDRYQDGFAFITQFYADSDASQLVLGQWRDNLIMMNGDDYANRAKMPRIAIKLPEAAIQPILVSVSSNPAGVRFYLNGRLTAHRPGLQLSLPAESGNGRIVLGNSVHGTQSWLGEIRGFALFARALNADEIARHEMLWREAGDFGFIESLDALVLFLFNEQGGEISRDRSGHGIDLTLGGRTAVLERRFLQKPWDHFRLNRGFVIDFLVNLLGFMPFGIGAAFVLSGVGVCGFRMLFYATAMAAALSLCIEITQAWMPSRNSSLLDLLLNTIGGLGGAAVVRFAPRDDPAPGT